MSAEPMEASANGEKNLLSLPYDVIVVILDNLPLKQIIHLRTVCRHLKETIDEYLKTIQILAIYEKDYELSELSSMRRTMDLDMDSILRNTVRLKWNEVNHLNYFDDFHLYGRVSSDDRGYDSATIMNIAKFFPKLTELYLLNYCKELPINELTTSLPGLKKLAIARVPAKDTIPKEHEVETFVESLYGFKRLETLIVIYPNWTIKYPELIQIRKEFFQQLRRLHLPDIMNMQHTIEQSTNVECQDVNKMKLESITLDEYDMELETNTIQHLSADNFPNLKHVSVKGDILDDGFLPGFVKLFQVNKAIQSIQIYSLASGSMDAFGFFEALNAFPELKWLQINVESKFGFGRTFMLSLADYMPNFTHLETIVIDIRTWNEFHTFPAFMRSLQRVAGGSVQKIVLQSISERCHVEFQRYLETDFSYQIEILPAKSFLD